MAEPKILTSAEFDQALLGNQPVLVLFSNGEGLRGDFVTAYRKLVDENPNVVIAKLDPSAHPQLAARYEVGSKPVLLGWYCGEEILRRPRPWGTDVPLAVEMLQQAVKDRNPEPVQEKVVEPVEKQVVVHDAPVIVTDATFEQTVLMSEIPVLVDFWAEWCGPCRTVAPTLEKLAKEFAGQVMIAKVNVDENPGLSQTFKVMSIPNIMLIKNRTIVFNQPGALPEPSFRDLLNQLIKLEVPMPQTKPQPSTPQ
jgi:thioredoxin 1